jgi:hypothetical protein
MAECIFPKITKLVSFLVCCYVFQFATRAKNVKNKPEINEVLSDTAMLKKYRNQISELQKKVAEVRKRIFGQRMY